MTSFKDKDNREWLVEPTISNCRKLKSKAENPIDVLNPDSLAKAFDDPYGRFDMLWAFCESQAEKLGVSIEDFDKSIATEQAFIESARALRSALNDFFRRVGMESLAATIAETCAARERLDRLALTKIGSQKSKDLFELAVKKADEEMDAVLEKAEAKLLKIGGSNSTSSPESPE